MFRTLISGIILIALQGCGKSTKDDLLDSLNGLNDEAAASFSGEYVSLCNPIDFNGKKMYQKVSMTFDGSDRDYSDSSSLFEDAFCKTELAALETKGSFAFSNRNRELKLTAISSYLTPQREDMTQALNRSDFCSLEGWSTHAKQNLMVGACASQFQEVSYFFNSRDSDANVIELIECPDAQYSSCLRMTLRKQ